MLSPHVRELRFERVAEAPRAPFEFLAGQWVSLVLPLAEGEGRRAYSIASAPDGTPGFDIAVTRVEGGAGSTYLHAMDEGQTVRAIGPQGFFTRPRAAGHPSLFVGTGTGVTPLRSMILDTLASGETSPITLVFGVREEADRLYVEEFDALMAKHPQFKVHYTLSRPSADWRGLTGYVQTHIETLWRELEATAAPHVYICGLERMVSAVRDVFRKGLAVDRKQVHSERYD
jgi:ferredoxin-NADP reductase